jgi:hypothetical protein
VIRSAACTGLSFCKLVEGKIMHRARHLVLAALLLGIGYVWGLASSGRHHVNAQEAGQGISEDTSKKIREAQNRLQDAKDALAGEGRYEAITEGLNAYLIVSGGGNAREDLESGVGVDPETFAGLYAGRALPEIQTMLGVDDKGRITYKDQPVRMYSKSRLQRNFANRLKIMELGQ